MRLSFLSLPYLRPSKDKDEGDKRDKKDIKKVKNKTKKDKMKIIYWQNDIQEQEGRISRTKRTKYILASDNFFALDNTLFRLI